MSPLIRLFSRFVGCGRPKAKATRRHAATRRLCSFAHPLVFEEMEPRRMLSAVSINRSSDPSADTIYVAVSGSNTIVDVNSAQVYAGASSSISSLSITGTAYNDTIEFNYANGNPVPNGTISVDGNGGANTLTTAADANVTISWRVQMSGNTTSTITEANITQVISTALSSNDQAALYPPNSSVVSTFYGHGTGHGADLQANNGTYNDFVSGFSTVTGTSYNASDTANLDDQNAPTGTVVSHPTATVFYGSGYNNAAFNFQHVYLSSFNTGDSAWFDDSNVTAAATVWYAPTNCNYTGPGYNNAAFNFLNINMYGYNNSDTISMADSTSAPANFISQNYSGRYGSAYTEEIGTVNGRQYTGQAYFTNEFLNAALGTEQSTWEDTLGYATINFSGPNNSSLYMMYQSGANVTDTGFFNINNPRIYADNFTQEPVERDYVVQSAVPWVNFYPSLNTPGYWQVIPG